MNNQKAYYRNKYNKKNNKEINKDLEKKKFIVSIKNLISQKKLNKALSEIGYYLEKYPDDSYGLFQQGVILRTMGYLEDAEPVFQKIIELELDSKYSALYQLGVLYCMKKDWKQAEYYYRMNIESSPYPEIYSRIELSFIETIKGNIKNAELLVNGNYDKKINGIFPLNIFKSYSDISKVDVIALELEKAQLKITTKKIEEAKIILENIDLEACSSSLKRKYNLLMGKVENAEENYDSALEYLKNALSGPKEMVYWKSKLEMAKSYAKLGEITEALFICDEIMIDSKDYYNETKKMKGNIYRWNHQYEDAETEYLAMENNEGIYHIGKMKFINKEYEEAVNYFNKDICEANVLKANSDFYKSISLLKLGRYEETYQTSLLVNDSCLSDLLRRELFYAKLYLKTKLNDVLSQEHLTYTQKQIIDYNLQNAIDHINRDHKKDDSISNFYEDTDIQKLISELPWLLEKEDTNMFQNLFFEIYEIYYPNLGLVNGNVSNGLRVVMIPEDYHVVTMFPIIREEKKKSNCVESFQKKKTLSPIDKFNKKYGKK